MIIKLQILLHNKGVHPKASSIIGDANRESPPWAKSPSSCFVATATQQFEMHPIQKEKKNAPKPFGSMSTVAFYCIYLRLLFITFTIQPASSFW